MDETWLFVLARDPGRAKTRLAPFLSRAARADLAAAMLDDVIAATRGVAFARRVIVTESAAVRKVARAAGLETLDVPPSGTNGAARAAVQAARDGVRALLLVADLPLLTGADLDALLATPAPVVVAPDRHRRGTNALVLMPASVIAPGFGHDSYRVHRERAARAKVKLRVVRARGLSTDIDSPDDLRVATRSSALGRRTRALLRTAAFRSALAQGVRRRDA